MVYPDGNDIRYGYNEAGKVVERIDQRGIVTSYGYDGNYNMVSKIVDSNGAPIDNAAETFTYDGLGRMLSADKTVDGSNVSEVDFVYDESGRLYTESQKLFTWNARTVTYAYTQSSEPTNITYPSTASVGITRDWQDRIDTMTLGGYSYVEYQYIGSRVAKRTYPKPTNDIIYQPSYDNLGRITSAYTYVDGGSTVAKFDYTYDPNTNSITQQEYDHRDGDPVSAFAYDKLRRLTDVDYGIDDTAESFDLDKLGNRDDVDTRYAGQVDYAIDELTNRYDTVGGNSLVYDAAGNLTTDRQGYSYEYDYENRIVKITKSGPTTVAEYSYDALGRRVEKKDCVTSGNTRRYYYDKDWRVLDDYDGSGTLKRRYMCGNYIDEVLFSWVAPPGTHRYYVHDHLYSAVAILGYDSSALERYEYDAYGEPNILDASYTPRVTQASAYDNTYMFTGRQVDILDGGTLKIQYNRNRYYDYYTGRWTTQDPLGITPNALETTASYPRGQFLGGLNLLQYVSANPIMNTDPKGMLLEDIRRGARAIGEIERGVVRRGIIVIGEGVDAVVRGGRRVIGLPHEIECSVFRRLYNRVSEPGLSEEVRIKRIRDLYQAMGDYGGYVGYPVAAGVLRHWLSGGDWDHPLGKDHFMNNDNARVALYALLAEVRGHVKCDEGRTPTCKKNVHPGRGTDLFYATGPFTMEAYGEYRNSWIPSSCYRWLTTTVSMRDRYDWHEGKDVTICGVMIPDDWALLLQRQYGLPTFDVYAEWKEPMERVKCKCRE